MGKKAEVAIGAMKREDLDQVLVIERSSFSAPWSRTLFEQELRKPVLSTSLTACAEQGGRRTVLGYLVFWIVADEMHILNLAVVASERRKGIARFLVMSGLRYAAAKGARTAFLEVRASNTGAQKLYQSLGFTGSALRRNYYDAPPEDAVIMTLSEGAFRESVRV